MTSPDRFRRIAQDGAIKCNPPLPDSERHKTGNGAANYPFVRTLGGISLFSFSKFDPEEYQSRCPLSNWQSFIPIWHAWEQSIWIGIDRTKTYSTIIEPAELIEKWKLEKAYGHMLMPHIEAAHIGDISTSAFRSVLAVTCPAPNEWKVERRPLKASPSTPAPH